MEYDKFKEKAIKKHKGKYRYIPFEFKDSKQKVEIECPIHGVFRQTIYAHLKGQGCPKCACKRKSFTTEDFIKEAKEKFGDKFDYSKVEYKNKRTKVCIICKELCSKENPNGEFWQLPLHHLNSPTGMPFMGKRGKIYSELADDNKIKNKTIEFKERMQTINNNLVFDKFVYKGSQIKGVAICPIHGEFLAPPDNLLSGHGCPKCGKTVPLTFETFKERANNIHNNKYQYVISDKVRTNEKIIIICPEHGKFVQNVGHHLAGHGCPKCSRNKQYTTQEFIETAKEIHGDKWLYDEVEYVRHNEYVNIKCPKHGTFKQTPNSHLSGQGCPFCKESHMENEVRNLLEANNIDFIPQHTFNDIKKTNKLPFDFYLPKHNIIIECQGAQHFINVDFFGNNLDEQVQHDKIKYEKCNEKNIKQLYYTNVKEIEKLINKNKKLQQIYNKENIFKTTNDLLQEIKKLAVK